MDAMKFLLGATAALLLGAIIVAWQGMQRGVENASPDELRQLQEQIAELKAELANSKQGDGGESKPAPPVELTVEEQLAASQQRLAELRIRPIWMPSCIAMKKACLPKGLLRARMMSFVGRDLYHRLCWWVVSPTTSTIRNMADSSPWMF